MARVFENDKCKMIRILIVYSVSHQKPLMKSVMDNVSGDGIQIDILDINKWQITSYSNKELKHQWYSVFLRLFTKKSVKGKLAKKLESIIHSIFDKIVIKSTFINYDVIDFQYYNSLYYSLIPLAKKIGKKVKINLWGSDLFRTTSKDRMNQFNGYKLADGIQVATLPMYEKLSKEIPDFKNKINILPFGNQKLSDFSRHFDDPVENSFLPNYDKYKLMVVLGYNGSNAQQHRIMIEALNRFPKDVQSELYVVLPMTYGLSTTYLAEIKAAITVGSYSYDILENSLTDKQIFDLRRLSNLTVNIQTTDAFSGSLQEHILCGNVLLVGDWLPYSMMKNAGIFYLTTSIERLPETLFDAIKNYKSYRTQCQHNQEKMYNLSSWNVLAEEWKKMYLAM